MIWDRTLKKTLTGTRKLGAIAEILAIVVSMVTVHDCDARRLWVLFLLTVSRA